jgi:putative addiction module killer protein
MIEVIVYQTVDGKEPFLIFLDSIHSDQDRARIMVRLDRIEKGNLGDAKSVGGGVFELRFFFGSAYRVYFGMKGSHLVILLCGGNKSTQKKDIKMAQKYWLECIGDIK